MAPKAKNIYFIITTTPASYGWIQSGKICYVKEDLYSQPKKLKKDTIPVRLLGSTFDLDLPLNCLHILTQEMAELLLAIDSNKDRLDACRLSESLDQALTLVKGSEVTVEQNGKWLKGVIKYTGRLNEPIKDPIAGVFFGVELQGDDKGKGQNNGTHHFKRLFTCGENCGIFAPFNRIRPVHSAPADTSHPAPWSSQAETAEEELSVGDRVSYFIGSEMHSGMVLEILKSKGMVLISTDRDEHGKEGGERKISLDCVYKLEGDESEKMDTSKNPEINLNSVVEVDLAKGPTYGTVRWIGHLPEKTDLMAGLELEEDWGVNDGTFRNDRYFFCPPKRGIFVKVASCRPDSRFLGDNASDGHFDVSAVQDLQANVPVPPLRSQDVKDFLIGKQRGIQGHCNSCYMDSALFRLGVHFISDKLDTNK